MELRGPIVLVKSQTRAQDRRKATGMTNIVQKNKKQNKTKLAEVRAKIFTLDKRSAYIIFIHSSSFILLQGRCISSKFLLGKAIQRKPGRTCHNSNGYCNFVGQCVTVDLDGQLYQLRQAFRRLFSKESLDHSAMWLKRYW